MTAKLFHNWHLMRWLRLGLGLVIGIQAFELNDILLYLFSGFFLYQALFDVACCGSNGCSV
jgi:uncharacterized membrane protein HdeD (DUF308 family)